MAHSSHQQGKENERERGEKKKKEREEKGLGARTMNFKNFLQGSLGIEFNS